MLNILIVTPAGPRSNSGNRVTAVRWRRLLEELGHRVVLRESYRKRDWDLLIALHARKSASAVKQFNADHPGRPIIVALTGTDLYRDIQISQSARHSLETADRLVLLQADGTGHLPQHLQRKAIVIPQSAKKPSLRSVPLATQFEVCVCAHLRHVKDPFRAAMAVRRLPAASRIGVTHVGKALTPAMENRAKRESERNERYRWIGCVTHERAKRIVARSRLVVVSSRMEGGANTISEAIVAGVPVVASRVSGNIGLLGDTYPGLFEFGSTRQLRDMLLRCEEDRTFYRSLKASCRKRRARFLPRCESAAWKALLARLRLSRVG